MFDLIVFVIGFAIGFLYSEQRNRLIAKAERERVLSCVERFEEKIKQRMKDNIENMK
jgi:hypothetical protein